MKKLSFLLFFGSVLFGCKKSSDDAQPTPNPCSGVNITVNASSSSVSSCTSNNGSISASATGSTGFTYSIDGNNFQASGNFTGLAANSYTVTAKDANGCTGSATVNVGSSTPSINVTATPSNVTSCSSNNGSISASATGSTGFTYSINGTTFQANGNFSNLAAGNYTVTAKDANGCTGTRAVTVGTSTPSVTVTPNVNPVVPCSSPANNGSITLSGSGGTSPYQFSFNGGAFSANATLNNQAAGNVTVQAKDANGCVSSTQTVAIGTATAGPLFTAVKNIINSRCSGCHTGGGTSGGANFSTDCGIVSKALRIQARAVTLGTMPPSGAIPANEQQAITNWINAGGQFNQ